MEKYGLANYDKSEKIKMTQLEVNKNVCREVEDLGKFLQSKHEVKIIVKSLTIQMFSFKEFF